MPISGVSFTIQYFSCSNIVPYNPIDNDQLNHVIKIVRDDNAAQVPTNLPTSVGEGVYNLVLTAAEALASTISLRGKSNTSGVLLVGTQIAMQVPTTGAGPNTVVLTINDGTNPIQNAAVSATISGQRFTAITDINGLAIFNLVSGTYVIALSALGYSFAGASLVVGGDVTQTYSMTLNTVILPSNPAQTLALGVTKDSSGNIQPGVTVNYQLITGPGIPGNLYHDIETTVSDGSGNISVAVLQNSTYLFWRDTADPTKLPPQVVGTSPLTLSEQIGTE